MNILIVDDDSTNRKLLGATLGAEGYSTFEACDGLEALRVLETKPIDAVISDVLMPNMDGYRFCAEVRRCESCGTIPFIFYSSTYTESADEKLALEFGADRFLRKPAPIRLIAETIEELAARRSSSSSKPAPEELDVMQRYNQALIRKLEKRNDQISARTAELHASETRLRAIFEAEPDCVLIADRGGKVTEINPAGLELFAVDTPEKLLDCTLGQLVDAKHLEAYQTCVEAVWRGKRGCVEFETAGPAGQRRWLEMHAAPLRDAHGEIAALLGIVRDNTARKELEAQFIQAQKMEVVGQLAGGVAHDFNNMLGIMMGYCEFAMSDLTAGTRLHEDVQTIFQTAQRAAALTRQLLIFSRKEMPQPRVLDVSDLVTGLDPMLRRLIGENIKFVTEPEVEAGCVDADPGQIEQVLMNLTVNARDAMPVGGTITVATSKATITADGIYGAQMPSGEYVIVSVADDGCGMSKELKAKIFDAFFTTKPAGQGTGLGLATCQSIVRRWKGHIIVESEPGLGTRFQVFLPRAVQGVKDSDASAQKGPLPRGTELILVVEDEPGLRELSASVLQKQGYQVIKAGNGREALRMVRDRKGLAIDLILTDMVMPEMGGRIMAEWLRATNPEIKILFTSGYTDCGLDGALDLEIEFLPKPYKPSDLVRRVRQVIDRKSAVGSEMAGVS